MPKFSAGEDLFYSTIPELNARLKAREFSAVELTRAFAERLEQLGPRYNALALPLTKKALKKAKEVDDDIKRERFRGPLQGIPFGAKDLLSLAGEPTTWGAKPYATQVFDYDATVIKKLDKTGAVLVGKLAMVELAGGGGYRIAGASLFGPGLNPWDVSKWSGGSSSGSGSAVAAGLVPFAIGSETSGSIITPAAYCGVTGLRPTYGLVSRFGAMALSWTLDKLGPLCRTAEDCALVLQTIAGGDSNDAASAGKSFYYTPQYARDLKDLRVGFAPVDFSDWADAETRPALNAAFNVVKQTGVQMVEAKLPDYPYGPLTSTIIGSEASSIFEPIIANGQIDQLADARQVAGLRAGLEILAKDYLKAMRARTLLKRDFRQLYGDLDILLAPARYTVAPPVAEPLDSRDNKPEPAVPGFSELIPAGNLAGCPALSIPCGFANGLPVGLQLMGPAFSENMLIAVGKAFQARTDWHRKRPPIA